MPDTKMISKKCEEQLENLRGKGYRIVTFTNETLVNPHYRLIGFRPSAVIGRGSYGIVYKAYSIDTETGELDKSRPLALKNFLKAEDVKPIEAKFFDSYYGQCEILTDGAETYMVMKYLPGKAILLRQPKRKDFALNVELASMDFPRRIEVIRNIMMAVNLIHHNTPNSGNALIHGDLNGYNIIVNIDKETNAIDVYIIDFGTAEETEDDQQLMQPSDMAGTPLFMANELVEKEEHGIKSDIFSLSPLFGCILGAKNPFASRSEIYYFNPLYYKTPYVFDGLLDNVIKPDYPFDIKKILVKFLERMQHLDPSQRPDSDETLLFFVKLDKISNAYLVNPEDPEIKIDLYRLINLANGVTHRQYDHLTQDAQLALAEAVVKPYWLKKRDLRRQTYQNLLAVAQIFKPCSKKEEVKKPCKWNLFQKFQQAVCHKNHDVPDAANAVKNKRS